MRRGEDQTRQTVRDAGRTATRKQTNREEESLPVELEIISDSLTASCLDRINSGGYSSVMRSLSLLLGVCLLAASSHIAVCDRDAEHYTQLDGHCESMVEDACGPCCAFHHHSHDDNDHIHHDEYARPKPDDAPALSASGPAGTLIQPFTWHANAWRAVSALQRSRHIHAGAQSFLCVFLI